MAVRLNGEEVKVDEKVIINSNGNELDIIEQVVAQEEGNLPIEEESLSLEDIENETKRIKQKEFELRVQKAMFETKVVTSDIICNATLTHIDKWCSYLQNGETPPEKMHNGMLLLKDSLDVVYKDGVGTLIYNEVKNLTPEKEKIDVYLESIKDMLPKYIKSKNDALGGRDAVKVYLDIEDVEVREVNEPEDSKELDKEVNTFAKSMQELINNNLSDVDNNISSNTGQNRDTSTSDTSILEWVGYAALAGAAAYGLYIAYDTFFGESSADMGDVVILNSADAFNIHI